MRGGGESQMWHNHKSIKLYLRDQILLYPGDSIRPVDPIVSDRIRVGFHRNPTSSIKNRSDPIWLLSDSFQSDSDPDLVGIERNPMNFRSDRIRSVFYGRCRIPMESDADPIVSDRIYRSDWISWDILRIYTSVQAVYFQDIDNWRRTVS